MKLSAVNEQEMTPDLTVPTRYGTCRESWLVLAALTVLYAVVITIGNRRYVWFDELLTFDIARSPSLHELWYRVQRFDCQPPTAYILSRISMSIFGSTPFGLRLPSMLEFYFGSMAIFLYVKRKVGTAFASVAVLMLWGAAPTLYYAVEARPYALLFLSFACLLLSWDTALRAKPRGWALFGISISTVALVGAHVFAPFTLLSFIVAEAVRFRRRKRPDYPLWAALLVPVPGMLLYIPLIRLYGGIIYPIHVSYGSIITFYADTFSGPVMAFALLIALLIPVRHGPQPENPRFSAEEMALLACMSLSPILLICVLMHRQGLFFDRYCLTSQVAILAALAIFLACRMRLNRLAAYAAAAALTLAILRVQVWQPVRHPLPQAIGVLDPIQPNLPIVVASGVVFVEMNHRENQALLNRLYFLKDRQAALQFGHINYFQDFEAPDAMAKAGFPFTANVASYSGFVRQRRQFLLLSNPIEWVFLKLLASGASIAFVGDYGMPYYENTLYLVTIPSSQSRINDVAADN